LDRDGWELVSLLADDRRPGSIGMPGASLGHELIRHGYVPDRYHHAAAQQGIFGWVQVDGTGPDTIAPLGRSQSVTNVGPCWRLPVFRAEDAPQPCCCAESGVQQSCEHCSPRHQEQVYGHAIAAPVSSSGGQG
jgi:hypothetical protein